MTEPYKAWNARPTSPSLDDGAEPTTAYEDEIAAEREGTTADEADAEVHEEPERPR